MISNFIVNDRKKLVIILVYENYDTFLYVINIFVTQIIALLHLWPPLLGSSVARDRF